VTGLTGDQTREHIFLVCVGHSYKKVCFSDTRLVLGTEAGTVSNISDNIAISRYSLNCILIHIHDSNLMPLVAKLFSQSLANLSATGYDYVHFLIPLDLNDNGALQHQKHT
jgi:hypothetical protein